MSHSKVSYIAVALCRDKAYRRLLQGNFRLRLFSISREDSPLGTRGATSKHHSTHSHSVACPSLCSNTASLPPTQPSSRIHRATSHPESSEHIPYSNKSRLTLLPGSRIALLPFFDVQQWKCQYAPHPRIPPTMPIHSHRADLSARTPPRAKTAAASIYPV